MKLSSAAIVAHDATDTGDATEQDSDALWPPSNSTDLSNLIASATGQDQMPASGHGNTQASAPGGSAGPALTTWFARGNRQMGPFASASDTQHWEEDDD